MLLIFLGHALRPQNQFHRPLTTFPNQRILLRVDSHPHHFRQHQRHNPMPVHARPVALAVIPARVLPAISKNKLQRPGQRLAFRRVVGRLMAHRRQRHDR